MATIGEQLLTPESGWQRIDDTDLHFNYEGTGWITSNNQYLYNGNEHATNGLGDTVSFKFYGTKLRILSGKFTNNPDNIDINIDGTSYKYNQSGTSDYKAQVILFEKLGLDLDVHTVIITSPSSNLYIALDCIDIDNTGYMVASVGNKLLQPETGWRRIDNTDDKFIYDANAIWQKINNNAIFYNNTIQYLNDFSTSGYIKFYFYGTKIRLIQCMGLAYSDDITIIIDEKEEKFSQISNTTSYQRLVYEKNNLPKNFHSVVLKAGTKNRYRLENECIDIDDDGYLITEEEYKILTSKKYLIKDNSIYKTIVNNELVTIENATVEFNKEYPDNTCITNLNEVIKFIPQLTKGWKIISNENFNSIVTAIETNQQLVLANGDFSVKLANNIDYFTSTSTITNTSSIKIVLSTDSGLNWYTTNNNGTSWAKISCTPPLKKYTELSSEEIIAWNNFKDEVFTNGINIKDLRNINFNTLKCEKIRFAYVLNTNAADDVNIIKSLEWQFDSIGSYDQMNTDSVKISITNNAIKVTPLKNVDLMKINVGISSNEQQELDTSGLLDKKTFLGKEINSVKKADFATSLDVADQLNGSILYYGTNNNDSELKMRQFPAGTHTEHIDSYNFENLTKGIPQAINFVKEIPDVNCFAEALQYVNGESNLETIFEKYSNDNITIKTNNLKVDESGISINKSYNLSCKLNSDNLYESEIINKDNFFEITGMEAE